MKTKENLRALTSLKFIIALLSIATVLIALPSCGRNKNSISKIIELGPSPPPPPPILIELDSTFIIVDKLAEFKAGDGGNALFAYISRNIKYPEDAKINNIQGKVWVTYGVEKDGSVSKVALLAGTNPLLDAEAVRVISSLPKFEKPAKLNGETITTRYKILISFVLK